jgi:hypothetical protein
MFDGTETEIPMSTETETGQGVEGAAEGGGDQEQEQTFTQADVDRIVRERLARQAKNEFGDYDTLKAKAAGAQTVEQKLADLESKYAAAEARALRSDIAAKHGISAEDRDLFLTGTDEATLTAQAQRLAARDADRKKQGNVAPEEGKTKTSGTTDVELRQFARDLFSRAE